jgi:hypothetical protein
MAQTTNQRKRVKLQRKNGVRWCSVLILWYCDPVNDTILGFMHNWLQGVLEHQLQVLWEIGCDGQQTKNLAELDAVDENLWTDDDISEAGGETDVQEVCDEETNFDPDKFNKWREQYLQATQSEEDEYEDEDTPTGTPADIDDPMDGSTPDTTPVPESIPPDDTDDESNI